MSPSATKRPPVRRRLAIIAIVILAVIGMVTMVRRRASVANQVQYEFGTVERGSVRVSVTAEGTIQPWKIVDVKSNVAGRINSMPVNLGDQVRAGQLIALIDPTDSRVAQEQSRASLVSAQANAAEASVTSAVQPKITSESIAQARAGAVAAQKALTQSLQNKRQLEDQLAQLKDVTVPQNLADASSNLQQTQANVDTAQTEYKRQQDLLAKGYAAQSDVDAAYAKLATLQASLKSAGQHQKTIQRQNDLTVRQIESQIAQAQSTTEGNQAKLKQAQAALHLADLNGYQDFVRQQQYQAAKEQVASDQAQLQQANTNLAYCRITAPVSGVVITKNVEEGTVVPSSRSSVGSTGALIQIGATSPLWVVCNVDETGIAQIHVGQRARVHVDAYPDMRVMGKVIRVDPQAQVVQNVTYIPVTVQLGKADRKFRPGMNAECDFTVAEARSALTVPNQALRESGGNWSVQELVKDKVVSVPVQVGLQGDAVTEIRSGLNEGARIITRIIQPDDQSGTNNPFAMGPMRRPPANKSGAARGR